MDSNGVYNPTDEISPINSNRQQNPQAHGMPGLTVRCSSHGVGASRATVGPAGVFTVDSIVVGIEPGSSGSSGSSVSTSTVVARHRSKRC